MDKIFPEKINNYLELIRLNKPIGFMLLLWPCWFSLAYINLPQHTLITYYLLFLCGAIIMRSAGCIFNDIVDKDFLKRHRENSRFPYPDASAMMDYGGFMLGKSFQDLLNFYVKKVLNK